MANPIAEALLAGQRIKSGQQQLQLNEQKIQQQGQLQAVQQEAQNIFNLQNMVTAGATDEDLLGVINQSIQGGQGSEAMIDAGNILQTGGREAFIADLDEGRQHIQTFQDAGLIDLPGLQQQRVQSSVAVPGGTRQTFATGETQFIPRTEEEVLSTAAAESEKLQRSKQSKLELERGISDVKVKQQVSQQLNKDRSERVKSFRKRSDQARQQIPKIDRLLRQLKTANTGSFAEKKLKFKRFFNQDVSDEESFLAATNELILDQATKMSGALSQADLDFLVNSTANLGISAAGNAKILSGMKELANHSIGVNTKFTKFRKKKGSDPLDFEAPVFQVTASGKKFGDPVQDSARTLEILEILKKRRK